MKPDVVLLYSRPTGQPLRQDREIERLHCCFEDVRLKRMTPDVARLITGTWVSPSRASVMVLRDGQVFGVMIGRCPFAEVHEMVTGALSPA